MSTPGPAPTVTPDDALAVFGDLADPGTPLTAREVAEALGCSRRTAYAKLETLAERGDLDTKKTGARGRVWWRPLAAQRSAAPERLDRSVFASFVRAVVDYAIFTLDPRGRIASWNEGASRIKGYDEASILGRHVSVFYTESDRDEGVPDRNLVVAREAGRVEDEGWRVRADGSRFWANVVITAIRDDGGELLGFTKVTRDMTERREREEALRRERDLLDEVLETSPVAMAVVDDDGDLLRSNTYAKRTMGIDEADPTGRSVGSQPVFDEDGQELPASARPSSRAIRTGEPVTDEHVQVERADGGRAWVSVNATPITGPNGAVERVVLAAEDITQLKEQARRLERRRDELAAELDEVFERVTDGFYALDGEWRFTYVNERAAELLQRSGEALIGERFWTEFPAARESPFWDRFRAAMETSEPVSFELRDEPRDVWLEVTAYPSETGLSVYLRDVTERKEQERQLQEQRERYRSLLAAAPVAIAILGEDGRLQYVNDAGVELVGAADSGELLGRPATAFVHPDDRDEATAGLRRVIEDREPTPTTELRLRRGDGDDGGVNHAMVTSVPITYAGDPASQTVMADITARKARERQLARQREQLAALNQLNRVVQDITHVVIESSTRAEIESLVTERLADADSYRYAWIGSVDHAEGRVQARTAAGIDAATSVALGDPSVDQSPTANAVRTGEIHVAQRLDEQADEEPWRQQAIAAGVRSVAAIPIGFEGTISGVLTIGSARPTAFDPDESDVVVQLGRVVGHAITAIDRKLALISQDVVEIRFRVRDLLDTVDVPHPAEGAITLDRTIPAGDDAYLVYGTATGAATDAVDALVDALPRCEAAKRIDERDDAVRFELTFDDPPAISAIASYGGRVESARIEAGDYEMVVHVPPATDVRELVDAVRESYAGAEVVAQRRRTRSDQSLSRLETYEREGLTDRQRSVLEAAYFAGYFEWPRDSTGESIAGSLDISPSTFHQHVRLGQRKLMRAVFGEAASAT